MSDDVAPIGHNNPPSYEELMAEANAGLISQLATVADKTTAAVDALRPAKGKPPVINSDADVLTVAPLAKEARGILKQLEEKRKAEKDPHYQAGLTVDAFFKGHKSRAERIFQTLEAMASDYQNRKIAAEKAAAREEARKAEAQAQKLREEAEKAKRPETSERKLAQAAAEERRADAAEADAEASNAQLGGIRDEGKTVATARTKWEHTVTDYEAIPLDKIRHYLDRKAIDKALKAYVGIHKEAADLPGVTFTETAKTQFR